MSKYISVEQMVYSLSEDIGLIDIEMDKLRNRKLELEEKIAALKHFGVAEPGPDKVRNMWLAAADAGTDGDV